MLVNKDYQWILVPLAKPQQQNPVHFAKEINANQIDHVLKRNEVDQDFLGIIWLVKEEVKGMDALEKSTTMQTPKWD